MSEEIGVDIKLVKTEANVGKFSVDILAEEEASGRKIIIENQLEDTDHDHLGKIITYASGYDAEIIIWIVRGVRDEHQKAIDWLNEHTDENISFFLIKIELWQIEGSNPAPKFEIIVSPNEWAKTIKTSSSSGEMTNTKLQQLEFWTKYKNFVQNKDTSIHLQTPRPVRYFDISIGNSDCHIALIINSRDNLLVSEIYIPHNKLLFNYLNSKRNEIEKEIGESAIWVDAPKASVVKISTGIDEVFSHANSERCNQWLYEKTVLFKNVFSKYVMEFRISYHDK